MTELLDKGLNAEILKPLGLRGELFLGVYDIPFLTYFRLKNGPKTAKINLKCDKNTQPPSKMT